MKRYRKKLGKAQWVRKMNTGLWVSLLLIALFFSTFAVVASSTNGNIFWHVANGGLRSDVQAMGVAPSLPAMPGLPSTFHAGTWGDGVFHSTDHGATWQPANTGITLPLHIQGGLAVNPVTPTILYAGDYYGGGLYRSADGGDLWTLSVPTASIRAIAVHPLTPLIILTGD